MALKVRRYHDNNNNIFRWKKKRRMFVKKKKKINLDFLRIQHKHSSGRGTIHYYPLGGLQGSIENEKERKKKKKWSFVRKTSKIYMRRAAHSQLSPSYYFLAPKGTDNNAYAGVLFIPGAYTSHKNCGHNNSS